MKCIIYTGQKVTTEMNDQKHIEELFHKLVDNRLTEQEYNILIDFIKRPGSREKLEQIMAQYLRSDRVMQKEDSERTEDDVEALYHRIINQIDNKEGSFEPKKKTRLLKGSGIKNIYKLCAALIVFAGLSYVFQTYFLSETEFPSSITTTEANNIILKLDNGEVKVISESDKKDIIGTEGSFVASQNGNRLNYTNKSSLNKLVYNELTIPYGKQFDLILADGTQVKLNAGSWIKYPIQFLKGKSRKVFLKGEAYFDVVKDQTHPFVVNTGGIGVQVLGTQFNISHYPEDSHINTVLVEGSVKVYKENKKGDQAASTVLTPGHKAAWDIKKMQMAVEEVDVTIYTSWKEGILKFKNLTFHSIRKKLERHFNITIENQYQFLEYQIYTASFTGESIEEILNAFNEDTPFTYEVEGDKITIIKQSSKSRSQ